MQAISYYYDPKGAYTNTHTHIVNKPNKYWVGIQILTMTDLASSLKRVSFSSSDVLCCLIQKVNTQHINQHVQNRLYYFLKYGSSLVTRKGLVGNLTTFKPCTAPS